MYRRGGQIIMSPKKKYRIKDSQGIVIYKSPVEVPLANRPVLRRLFSFLIGVAMGFCFISAYMFVSRWCSSHRIRFSTPEEKVQKNETQASKPAEFIAFDAEKEDSELQGFIAKMPAFERAMEDYFFAHELREDEEVNFVVSPEKLSLSVAQDFHCRADSSGVCVRDPYEFRFQCENGILLSTLYSVKGPFCKWQIARRGSEAGQFLYYANGLWDNTGRWEYFFFVHDTSANKLGRLFHKKKWYVSMGS